VTAASVLDLLLRPSCAPRQSPNISHYIRQATG
jgi:hypothetical protein